MASNHIIALVPLVGVDPGPRALSFAKSIIPPPKTKANCNDVEHMPAIKQTKTFCTVEYSFASEGEDCIILPLFLLEFISFLPLKLPNESDFSEAGDDDDAGFSSIPVSISFSFDSPWIVAIVFVSSCNDNDKDR